MSEASPLIVYDRSRVVQDWKCPRSRYYNYEYAGKGIVPRSTSLPLYMGISIHDALSVLASSTRDGNPIPVDDLATAAYKQLFDALTEDGISSGDTILFAKEQATLCEGLIRGFVKHVWPRLLEKYPKIILVEAEIAHKHGGLTFMSKPDLVLGNDEENVYIEYKSTSSKKEGWINSWSTAVQLHSTVVAIKETYGIDVNSVIVQGLYKGYEAYGKQSSPFCYAYLRKGHPPFSQDELSYIYQQGYKRTPVWELPGGIKKWVEDMPDAILTDQFPQTAPIYIKEDLVEAFFKQREIREHEIARSQAELASSQSQEETAKLLDATFPQRFDQCVPSFGFPCPYNKLCHGFSQDPLQEGFDWRTPHHTTEELSRVMD